MSAPDVRPHSIARHTRAGLLPCLRINRRVIRYEPQTVQAFFKSATLK